MGNALEKVMEKHRRVVEDGYVEQGSLRHRSYVMSTLRGGVGKSTLAFNLAFEMASHRSMLLVDLCAQCNLTEALLRDVEPDVTILNVLQPRVLGPAFGTIPSDPSYRVSTTCPAFKGREATFLIAGDPRMFAFPSTLYQSLQIANAANNDKAVKGLLESLKDALNQVAKDVKTEGILMDTSPFYAGGTHLAWCAADAVIIPVRVDEHSIASLELTLDLLSNPSQDFMIWNQRAGGRKTPRVAAIVMTMVGSKSQLKATPDKASRMFIERALEIAARYGQLFDFSDPADAFAITDDFMSSGRISGSQGIPISKLQKGKFYSVGINKRLQVNRSVERYQKELAYLVSVL